MYDIKEVVPQDFLTWGFPVSIAFPQVMTALLLTLAVTSFPRFVMNIVTPAVNSPPVSMTPVIICHRQSTVTTILDCLYLQLKNWQKNSHC